MKEIVFVTSNPGKIASAQRELKDITVHAYEAELIEPRSDDIKEIAKQKVKQAYNMVKQPCISMDSGFYISQLNGFPRAYVNHMLDTIGIQGVLKLMDKENDRSCEFRSSLAYYDGQRMEFFESKSRGAIATSIRGENGENKWSDLWYIFVPERFEKTLAEFSDIDFELYSQIREESCMTQFGNWYRNL